MKENSKFIIQLTIHPLIPCLRTLLAEYEQGYHQNICFVIGPRHPLHWMMQEVRLDIAQTALLLLQNRQIRFYLTTKSSSSLFSAHIKSVISLLSDILRKEHINRLWFASSPVVRVVWNEMSPPDYVTRHRLLSNDLPPETPRKFTVPHPQLKN